MTGFKWGTVTDTGPLRVKIDGDTAALPVTPDSLIDPAALVVGDRVRCELSARRITVHGRAGGGATYASALLDSTYVGPGPARVSFLPDTTVSTEAYQWVGKYDPSGNRVVNMMRRGTTWVITGHSGEAGLGGKVAIELLNGWQSYNYRNGLPGDRWAMPRAQRLVSGVVVLSGLIGYGTSTGGTVIAQLPVGCWPDTDMLFPVNNGDTAKTVVVRADGKVVVEGTNWVAGTYISLDGIAFPAAGVAQWINVGSSGSGFANGWSAFNSAVWGPPRFWKDPYGFTWFAGLIGGGSTASDNLPMVTLPAGYGSGLQSHTKAACSSAFGFVGSGFNGANNLTWKTGSTGNTWLSLGGVVLATADAVNNNPWVPAGLLNGWTHYSAGFPTPGFLRRADGLGMSKGLVKGGVAPAVKISNLRAEHMPRTATILYGVSAQAFYRHDIYGRGWSGDDDRGAFRAQTGSSTWLSWDGHVWMVGD